MFSHLFSRLLGRYKGAAITAIGIIAYTFFVGASEAVVRTASTGAAALLGKSRTWNQGSINHPRRVVLTINETNVE